MEKILKILVVDRTVGDWVAEGLNNIYKELGNNIEIYFCGSPNYLSKFCEKSDEHPSKQSSEKISLKKEIDIFFVSGFMINKHEISLKNLKDELGTPESTIIAISTLDLLVENLRGKDNIHYSLNKDLITILEVDENKVLERKKLFFSFLPQ